MMKRRNRSHIARKVEKLEKEISPQRPQPPNLVVEFLRPNTVTDSNGREQRGEPIQCEVKRAKCGENFYERLDSETLDVFKNRVLAAEARDGAAVLVVMLPDGDVGSDDAASAQMISRRTKTYLAAFNFGGRSEAFISTPGETESAFEFRMRERWGSDAVFGVSCWPSIEPCPYTRSLALGEETQERMKLVQ